MKIPQIRRRTLTLIAVIVPLVMLFVYVAARSGPLAPIKVTVTTVGSRSLSPGLFGIGTVEARYTYKIGPTFAGRVKRLAVHVGDSVTAGQVFGEMDTVDLEDRINAQQAAIKSAEASLQQAIAKQSFAQIQATRYEKLLKVRGTSEESAVIKGQELKEANADLVAKREDVVRQRAELEALYAQRNNLYLVAPVNGLVVSRDCEPGTTVVAGQSVIEVIDPQHLWVDARFDQISATGLESGLPAKVILRSRQTEALDGKVMRIEPRADAVTEETLAKIIFDELPAPLPPLGELVEVTVQLGELPATPIIPNAAVRTVDGQRGVWKIVDGSVAFTPLNLGRSDLNGSMQVLNGLSDGDQVVVYSSKTINAKSRIHVVTHLTGIAR